ncbi:hypothetical protein NFJ02_01g36430 [Pycnococcus provasolii]
MSRCLAHQNHKHNHGQSRRPSHRRSSLVTCRFPACGLRADAPSRALARYTATCATNGRRSDDSAATADAPMQCVMPVLASAMIAISVSATSPAWALESDAGDDADVVAAAIARCRTQTCVDLLSRPANAKKLTRGQRLEQWRDRRKSFARREAQDVTTFSKERQFQMRYERAYVLKSLAEQAAAEEGRATGVSEEEIKRRVEREGRIAFEREVAAIDREEAAFALEAEKEKNAKGEKSAGVADTAPDPDAPATLDMPVVGLGEPRGVIPGF